MRTSGVEKLRTYLASFLGGYATDPARQLLHTHLCHTQTIVVQLCMHACTHARVCKSMNTR